MCQSLQVNKTYILKIAHLILASYEVQRLKDHVHGAL